MPLAGDHDDVPGLRDRNRALDRGGAIRLDLDARPGAGQDLGDDRVGILAAWVVGCDDRDIGELGGDPAHDRPLPPVAVAAAAEHAHDAVGRDLARRVQDVLERLGLVRVVDDDCERLARIDRLEPSRHSAECRDTVRDRLVVDRQQARDGDGGKDVFDVEPAAEVRPQLNPARA